MPTTIVWFRNNLRTDDQPALAAAAKRGRVLPLYILDPQLPDSTIPGGASSLWMHHSLVSLDAQLTGLGSPLVLRTGPAARVLIETAQAIQADQVACCESIDPFLHQRDEQIEHELHNASISLTRHPMNLLWEVGSILTKAAKPYQVFTPFWKTALNSQPPAAPREAPRQLEAPLRSVPSIWLEEFRLRPGADWGSIIESSWTPGEPGARAAFDRFIEHKLRFYHTARDRLDGSGCSMLSPHIHFGELSVRRIWETITRSKGDPGWAGDPAREHFLREIAWREFAHHLDNHFPSTRQDPLREQFNSFPWIEDAQSLAAWQHARTGYPVVDAAMRQLWAQGWMPNRARMIVASFLCKDLLISWRHGASWFLDTLVDADLANNTLGWQWTAGCGADAAPYFRIFNPVSQARKFDPDGIYIKKWIPELQSLDPSFVHAPWEAPPLERARAGVALGETYPERIIDHNRARTRALQAYETMKSGS